MTDPYPWQITTHEARQDMITQPFTVRYTDTHGSPATDRFQTRAEAESRVAYLRERGRECELVDES